MVPALIADAPPLVTRHHTVGCSTGYMEDRRGNWPALVDLAAETSSFAIELSAVSEPELPGLLEFLDGAPQLPFHFVSVHAPSKGRKLDEQALVDLLVQVPAWIDAIVVHPDTIADTRPYRQLGRRLALENMDTRKASGHTAKELASLFEALPEAGLCFDIAHAKDVDSTMEEARHILDTLSRRLRHVHVSSLDESRHHVPLTTADQEVFEDLLARCKDVPWILEAPPR